jgi:hypothetical protein
MEGGARRVFYFIDYVNQFHEVTQPAKIPTVPRLLIIYPARRGSRTGRARPKNCLLAGLAEWMGRDASLPKAQDFCGFSILAVRVSVSLCVYPEQRLFLGLASVAV